MKRWQLEPAHDLGMPRRERLRSLKRESGLVEVVARLGWWSAVRGYMAVAHRLAFRDRHHAPAAPPFVLVSNHASHLDTLVLAAALRWRLWSSAFPIAAGDTFFETPVLATFATGLLNALPMWRRNCGSHAMRELRERLTGEPCGYILFPEGTRSRDGAMAPFRSGIGMIVAATPVPVVPAHIEGSHLALPPGRRMPAPRSIRVRFGPPLQFAGVPNGRPGWTEVAARCEAAVRALAPG